MFQSRLSNYFSLSQRSASDSDSEYQDSDGEVPQQKLGDWTRVRSVLPMKRMSVMTYDLAADVKADLMSGAAKSHLIQYKRQTIWEPE